MVSEKTQLILIGNVVRDGSPDVEVRYDRDGSGIYLDGLLIASVGACGEEKAIEWASKKWNGPHDQFEVNEVTDVVYRVFRAGGDVIAIFPGVAGTMDPHTCESYQHYGQHGSCDPLGLMSNTDFTKGSVTRPAIIDSGEHLPLHRELELIGYRLRIVQRIGGHYLAKRQQQVGK